MKVLMDTLTKELIIKKVGDKISEILEREKVYDKYADKIGQIVENKVIKFINDPDYNSFVLETTFIEEREKGVDVIDLTKLPEDKLEEAIDRIATQLVQDILLEFNFDMSIQDDEFLKNLIFEALDPTLVENGGEENEEK